MKSEKYFAELTRVLALKDIHAGPPEKGELPILLDGDPACCVRSCGETFKYPRKSRNSLFSIRKCLIS